MILVDLSEAQSGIPEMLDGFNIPKKVGRLSIGDYLIPAGDELKEALAFERKTCSDFIASKLDGRLNKQLIEMSTHFYRSFIILEGSPTLTLMNVDFDRKIFYSTVMSTVLRRSTEGVQGVVSMIPTDTPLDTAHILKYAHEKVIAGDMDLHPNAGALSSTNREIAILAAFPNIGPSKAKALLMAKGSLLNVFNSTIEELDAVEGIGPKIAESLATTLQRHYAELKPATQ